MATNPKTTDLLQELEAIDRREDEILDVLLRRGARLERERDEAEQRRRAVTVGELQELAHALDALRARITAAEAGPTSSTNGEASPATLAALAAGLHAQDAESDRLRAQLRERLLALREEDDHSPNGGARTFRLTAPRMSGKDVRSFQAVLNRRFEVWGVDRRVPVTGAYGPATRRAARQVAYGLGVAAADYEHGFTPALRQLIRTPSGRSAEQLARARKRRGWLRKLRGNHGKADAHRAQVHRPGGARPVAHPLSSGLAGAIRAGGGRYEAAIVREAKRSKLPVALVCAVIEQETHFRNVFGHDGGPRHTNPIKSPPGGLLEVTKERYLEYRRHRDRGEGQQGVGPMQLTSGDLQDRADRAGGCWRPDVNIRIGCAYLAERIAAFGLHAGVQAYNGADGDAYSKEVFKRERAWRSRLAGAEHPSPRPHTATRTFRVTAPPMAGKDVRAFQVALNHRFATWGVDRRVAVTRTYGPDTRKAARQVAYGLGVAAADYRHGFSPALRRLIRTPSGRSAEQLERARKRRGWLGRLRRHHAKPVRGHGALRLRAHAEAKKLVGVMEVGGNNRGKMVQAIIAANGGAAGEPWCGDFIAYCYRRAGSKSVTRAWAAVRQYLPLTGLKRTNNPEKGDLVRYRFDHIGMFVCWCDGHGTPVPRSRASHIKTIEGNTGRSGAVSDSSTGGDGVYVKLRARSLVADYIRVLR
jgi:hypothetical protein